MEYDVIFAYVWRNYRDYLSQSSGKKISTDIAFFDITELVKTSRLAAHTYISRWLNPAETTDKSIQDVFADSDQRQRICDLFKVPLEVWQAESVTEINQAMTAVGALPDGTSDQPSTIKLYDTLPADLPKLELGEAEQRTFAALEDSIIASDEILLEWSVPFQTGAAYVVERLPTSSKIAQNYTKIALMHIDPTDTDGKVEVQNLGRALGIDDGAHRDPQVVASQIDEQKVLLVIFGACQFFDKAKASAPLRVLADAVQAKKMSTDRVQVLLVANQRTMYGDDNGRLDQLTQELVVRPEERLTFFKVQLTRFLEERGIERELGDDDPRLKQVRWHYDQVTGVDVWPASIRLRAFFASNLKNESYFDPTQGFERLADMQIDHLPDISSLFSETVTFFHCICDGRKEDDGPIARFLRRNSTAVYWLTEGAITYVDREATEPAEKGKKRRTISRIDLSSCASLALKSPYKQLLQPGRYGHSHQTGYAMPLGVKAIIQDIWMSSDDSTVNRRAWIHYLTAKRMYEERFRTPMEDELPFQVGRGGSELFFLTEVIRHLMRACGENMTKVTDDYRNKWRNVDRRRVPEGLDVKPPMVAAKGCDPHEVWSFARYVVYEALLNGNSKELSRRHGAYALKLELLQLLSGGGDLGTKHIGMTESDHTEFLTEVGFALLDVGRLTESADAFEEVAEKARKVNDPELLSKTLINKALALGTMGRFKEAKSALTESRTNLEQFEKNKKTYQKNLERLESRTAQIAHLEGRDSEAIDIYRSLEKEGNRPTIKRDRALTYIFSLARRNRAAAVKDQPSDLYKAFALSLSNLAHSSSRANYHEVLGFEIALARLHRQQDMPMAAEACLDQAYLDILRDGCSERIYLTFLLEAGAVMIANGRPSRAYAAYLVPCYRRLLDRPFHAERKQVVTLIRKALGAVLEQISDAERPSVWKRKLRKDINTPTYLRAAVQPFETNEVPAKPAPFDKNPHYSFDLIGVDTWVARLETRKNVLEELADYENIRWKS